MSRCLVNEDRSEVGATAQKAGRQGLPIATLLPAAEERLAWTVEEKQLSSVIHQLFQNPRARQSLGEDPDRFIACLKVRPRVKAILGLMRAALLAQTLVDPQFNWWWGAKATGEDEPLPGRPGSLPFLGGTREPGLLAALG
jgi:hypothetical protein